MAEAYMHLQKRELAIKNFNKALSLYPPHLSARNNLGLILAEKGQYVKAIAEFKRVLQFDPSHEEAAFNLARAYTLSGQVGRAVEQYQKLTKSRSNSVEAYHNLGLLYLNNLNEPAKAKKCFEEVSKLRAHSKQATNLKKMMDSE
jgi:tetratricopeptide (TPR) repeat protein